MIDIKIKKLYKRATIPTRGHDDDAGLDLYTLEQACISPSWRQQRSANINTGISIALPDGVWAAILPRSSTLHKYGLQVVSAVIDPGYRGELFIQVTNLTDDIVIVPGGARLAQLIPHRVLQVKFDIVDDLPPSVRGRGGFGSTGE